VKYLILTLIFLFQYSYAIEQEITNWFNQESEKFLEIMNNSDGQDNKNYDEYIKFVEKNFAVKSIAYGLIPETILSKSDNSDLKNYEVSFQNYLTKTIYNLSNNTTSGEIKLIDIDLKDNIYQINSKIIEGRNSINLYWKVASINSSFKILDVIVENTSYFVTKKSEFSKILRKNRGDLRKLTEEINKI
jgi:ABC-type transporter MlaC component